MQGCPAFPLLTALLPLSPVLYLAIQFCFAPLRDVSDFWNIPHHPHQMCRFRMKPNLKIKLDCMHFFFNVTWIQRIKSRDSSPRWLNHYIHVSNTSQTPTCDFSHSIFFSSTRFELPNALDDKLVTVIIIHVKSWSCLSSKRWGWATPRDSRLPLGQCQMRLPKILIGSCKTRLHFDEC